MPFMHHAQLLVGSYTWACTVLPKNFQHESEDVRHCTGIRLGIDDVREIIIESYRTPLIDKKRTFVIAYSLINIEAQNALLKLLEEPPATTQFFIIIDREELLLKTVRSRLHVIAREGVKEATKESHDFLKQTLSERLEEIGKRMLKKDEMWARELLNAIEVKAKADRNLKLLQSLNTLRPFYDLPGASRKMILEHLSLNL